MIRPKARTPNRNYQIDYFNNNLNLFMYLLLQPNMGRGQRHSICVYLRYRNDSPVAHSTNTHPHNHNGLSPRLSHINYIQSQWIFVFQSHILIGLLTRKKCLRSNWQLAYSMAPAPPSSSPPLPHSHLHFPSQSTLRRFPSPFSKPSAPFALTISPSTIFWPHSDVLGWKSTTQ